jgi:exodeoxyribonuclease VII large subunit
VVAPGLVQGVDAPRSIVLALRAVQKVPELDVVIVARGGGGAEDWWAFNDEQVARAIVACRVPVVSGIGHEVDTTIADLVADVRAATPSNAAEIVVPKHEVLEEQLAARVRMLTRAMETRVARERLLLSRLGVKLKHPRSLLGRSHAALDALSERVARAMDHRLTRARADLEQRQRRVTPHDPRTRLSLQRAGLERARTRLELAPGRLLLHARRHLENAASALGRESWQRVRQERHGLVALVARLNALSPLSVLARGYAIALSERTGKALCSAHEAAPGDRLRVRLNAGELRAQVLEATPVAEESRLRETPG